MKFGRRAVFTVIAVLLGTTAGLVLAEYGSRYYVSYVQSREQMDVGFLVFNPQLGWEMARTWKGRHRHYDFDVTYTTNDRGLRGAWPERGFTFPAPKRHALVGDSFTFGLGVNDNETFVSILNDADPATQYLNVGIAGYSTDQEYLYLQQHLAEWQPDRMTLVVYLANDLLDNALAYPLQAAMGKPFFEVDSGELRLRNVPVGFLPKPQEERRRTLATMVLGEEGAQSLARSWRSRSQLARSLGLAEQASAADLSGMAARLQYPVDLFVRLVQQMDQLCAANGANMDLVLMPGRSYIEQPNSISAKFQDFLRGAIVKRQSEIGVPVIDLASRLRERYESGRQRLFHTNEGHLNPTGHAVVAEFLEDALTDSIP